jgi:hypothetical protein
VNLKQGMRMGGYAVLGFVASHGLALATLTEELGKVNTMLTGKVVPLVLGGGLVAGGGYSLVQGNIMKAVGQLGVAILIGLGVTFAGNGAFLTATN